MKLKELLEVIPDNYKLGIMDSDPDNYAILVFGNKKDIICGFGKKAGMPPAHVNALKVIAIHPWAAPYIPQAGVEMYGDDSAELRIDTRLLIEVSTEEEVK